jgi:hypothetical protein
MTLALQLFKNSIDTQEKLRLNFHSLSESELLEYGLNLNEGLSLTQLRVHKHHAVPTFIRWNVENGRGYEKAGRCSFFNMDDFLLMIERARLI